MKSSALGINLKNLRKSRKISQEELSKKLNISRQTLSSYECGNREPDLSTLINISNFFNCSIDSLFSDSNNLNLKLYSNDIEKILKTDVFSKKEMILLLKRKKNKFENSILEIESFIKMLESED